MYISNTTTHTNMQPMIMKNALSHSASVAGPAQTSVSPYSDTVNISDAAKQLMLQEQQGKPVHPVAPLPEGSKPSDFKDDYIALKKTQYKYNAASDAINLATGNGAGLSASSAYYLSTHDDARAETMGVYAAQSQAQLAESFMAQSHESDEQETNNSVEPYLVSYDEALMAASVSLLAAQKQRREVTENMAKTAA
ncbi:hypothetical protein [Motilimonas sp. E26]|uniref:hypothetical protein n=1 Tax=Motilimonas sp. E26 TaxID=2865674 RepID=UPI001E37A75F|nr:hypothetical protein [Motilimonas sp. E26]MCE0558445.1 hypothetical protein [Motilimonas sp. E26]